MATTPKNHSSTPASDTTPIAVHVEIERELSGPEWCAKYPGSHDVSTLRPSFQLPVGDFIAAIEAGGGVVSPQSTLRPKERAYLMEAAWLIMHGEILPEKVKPMDGVPIDWVHPTKDKSIAAATAMCARYSIMRLETKPAGPSSLHCFGEAIDMNISWKDKLEIKNQDGSTVTITSLPRDVMNSDLAKVGASYGVIKFYAGAIDRPHWSTTGR